MKLYSTYCFEVTVHQFFVELLHIKHSHLLYMFCYSALVVYHAMSAMLLFIFFSFFVLLYVVAMTTNPNQELEQNSLVW